LLRDSNRGVSRGLIVDQRPCPFDDGDWLPEKIGAWDPQKTPVVPDDFRVLVLRNLSAIDLHDDGDRGSEQPSRALPILSAATLAIRKGVPILIHTPQTFNELRKPSQSKVSPFLIDPARLLASEEIAYLLQVHCELPSPDLDPSKSATYLTPIERRLAERLRKSGIPFEVQVPIERYTVDFLIDGNLVVECDGEGWHDPAHDVERDRRLEHLNYRILRFTGRTIHHSPDACIELIRGGRRVVKRRTYSPSFDMTEAQRRAASHIDGPAIVVAPAGSGKTRVIEERVRMLIASGVSPQRICVISFTNAAVAEIRDRLESQPDVSIRTLNSFANQIVKDSYGNVTLIEKHRDPRVPTPTVLIRKAMVQVGYQAPARTGGVRALVEAIHNYRTSFVIPDPDDMGIQFEQNEGDSNELRIKKVTDTFLKIHEIYESEMHEGSYLDFNGQIIDAIRILAGDSKTRLMQSEGYDYWLIDEFQDLSPPKITLMRLLASPARNLMVVGDDDQIIYGFAGAKPQSFLYMNRDWRDTTSLPLDINFRSPHEIVVRTRWLIERNLVRIRKNTTPSRELAPKDCVTLGSTRDYASSAVDEFLELRKTRSTKDFVMLFRTRIAAAPVELLLTQNGIKFTPIARQSLLYDPVAKLVLSWLRVVNDVADHDDWTTVFKRPNRYLSNLTINWLVRDRDVLAMIQEAIDINCAGVPRANVKQGDDLLTDALRELLKTINAARRFSDSLEYQLKQLGIGEALVSEAKKNASDPNVPSAKPQRDGSSADPLTIYAVMVVLASSAVTWAVLEKFLELAEVDDAIDLDINAGQGISPDVLRLSTIHGFKGKEAPIVFVLGPKTGYMPDSRATQPFEVEEERRVAYVAATRAQERLYFWCSTQYSGELSTRQDGLTWEMYRQGLTEPPPKPKPDSPSPPDPRPHEPVREREPGLLERAFNWLLKMLDG